MGTRQRRSAAVATALQLAELGVAVPQVVAHRVARMAMAGAQPSARDQREFTGMVLEKQLAFAQAGMAMWMQALQWQQQWALSLLTGASPGRHAAQAHQASSRLFSAGLAPLHRQATANAKRLARTKLR